MKLKLQFGLTDSTVVVDWASKISDFPTLVIRCGVKWEFVVYDDDDAGEADHVCIFSCVQNYDPNWHATTYIDIDNLILATKECGCGAKSGEGHMLFCPKWTRF